MFHDSRSPCSCERSLSRRWNHRFDVPKALAIPRFIGGRIFVFDDVSWRRRGSEHLKNILGLVSTSLLPNATGSRTTRFHLCYGALRTCIYPAPGTCDVMLLHWRVACWLVRPLKCRCESQEVGGCSPDVVNPRTRLDPRLPL